MESKELAEKIVEILDSKKGIDIETIDVTGKTTLADYFVICSGNSTTQIKALADEVEFVLKRDNGIMADHVEGRGTHLPSRGESQLQHREALGDQEQRSSVKSYNILLIKERSFGPLFCCLKIDIHHENLPLTWS